MDSKTFLIFSNVIASLLIILSIITVQIASNPIDSMNNNGNNSRIVTEEKHLLGDAHFGVYIGGGVGGGVGLLILIIVIYCLCFRRRA